MELLTKVINPSQLLAIFAKLRLKTFKYLRKKTLSKMFDWVVNAPLKIPYIQSLILKKCLHWKTICLYLIKNFSRRHHRCNFQYAWLLIYRYNYVDKIYGITSFRILKIFYLPNLDNAENVTSYKFKFTHFFHIHK